jgi:hypothetical protein
VELNIQACMVAFNTYEWIVPCIESYYKHFNAPLLVVDNNPCPNHTSASIERRKEENWFFSSPDFKNEHDQEWMAKESDWLKKQPIIYIESLQRINNEWPVRGEQHGLCIDLTVEWCKKNNVDIMLHIEPDCLITGDKWYYDVLEIINKGAWVVATGGHPTNVLGEFVFTKIDTAGSMWVISKFKKSFVARKSPIEGYNWDTAQGNYFEAAVNGKAFFLDKLHEFKHYGQGSYVKRKIMI